MGINDNLIEDYRNVVTNVILDNSIITDILRNEGDNVIDSVDELLWTHLIPQQFIPDTITETGSYILYDIDENTYKDSTTYTELVLYMWILTHKDMPKYENRLRNDILSRELKYSFQYKDNLGITKNQLIYNRIFNSGSNKYTGRLLTFKITDWSDKVRKRD